MFYCHRANFRFAPGSARMAIKVLMESGVEPKNIMFLNLICAPEGIQALTSEYPDVQVSQLYTYLYVLYTMYTY